MNIIKKTISILKNEGIKSFLLRSIGYFLRKLYKIYARIMDFRIGKVSVDKKKQSRYKDIGAYATESTNYIWLKKLFSSYPLKPDDVFIDVGCGEGRVLTYLYLKKFRNKMTGIELDEEIAQIAKQRTKKCDNIHICQGNVLEKGEVFKDATAVYLFNPFNAEILSSFIEMIEENVDHRLTLYYANDIHRKVLDKREKWYIIRRNIIKNMITPKRAYSIYLYWPDKE